MTNPAGLDEAVTATREPKKGVLPMKNPFVVLMFALLAGCHSTTPNVHLEPCAPPAKEPSLSCPAGWTTSEVLACEGPVPKGCMKLDDAPLSGGYLACCCEGWGDEFSSYDCGVVG